MSSVPPCNFRDDLYLGILIEEKLIKLQNSQWGTWIRNKARKSYRKTRINQKHVCKSNGTSDVESHCLPTAKFLLPQSWTTGECPDGKGPRSGRWPTTAIYPLIILTCAHRVHLCFLNTQVICLSNQPAPLAPSICCISSSKWDLYVRKQPESQTPVLTQCRLISVYPAIYKAAYLKLVP